MCAKSVRSCPTLSDPMDYSPPGSPVHGEFPGENTGVACHALLQGMFRTQGLNLSPLHCRQILYHPNHQGSTTIIILSCLIAFLCFSVFSVLWLNVFFGTQGGLGAKLCYKIESRLGTLHGRSVQGRPRRHLPSYSGEEHIRSPCGMRLFSCWKAL